MSSNFGSAFMQAGRQAMRDGKVTRREYFRITMRYRFDSAFREAVEAEAYSLARAEAGVMADVQFEDIDWDELLSFLERIFELIMKYFL